MSLIFAGLQRLHFNPTRELIMNFRKVKISNLITNLFSSRTLCNRASPKHGKYCSKLTKKVNLQASAIRRKQKVFRRGFDKRKLSPIKEIKTVSYSIYIYHFYEKNLKIKNEYVSIMKGTKFKEKHDTKVPLQKQNVRYQTNDTFVKDENCKMHFTDNAALQINLLCKTLFFKYRFLKPCEGQFILLPDH